MEDRVAFGDCDLQQHVFPLLCAVEALRCDNVLRAQCCKAARASRELEITV